MSINVCVYVCKKKVERKKKRDGEILRDRFNDEKCVVIVFSNVDGINLTYPSLNHKSSR